MGGKGTSGVLLLLVATVLLMFAISGRFKDILTAAFPKLGGSSANGSSAGPAQSNPLGEIRGLTSTAIANTQGAVGAGGQVPGTGALQPSPTGVGFQWTG